MRRDSAAMGLLGVLALTWGLYLCASEAGRIATAHRLEGRTVAVQRSAGDAAMREIGGRRTQMVTHAASVTTLALPNGTECSADGNWGPPGSVHTVYIPRGADRCFVSSPLDYGLAAAVTLVGLAMTVSAYRQSRAALARADAKT